MSNVICWVWIYVTYALTYVSTINALPAQRFHERKKVSYTLRHLNTFAMSSPDHAAWTGTYRFVKILFTETGFVDNVYRHVL